MSELPIYHANSAQILVGADAVHLNLFELLPKVTSPDQKPQGVDVLPVARVVLTRVLARELRDFLAANLEQPETLGPRVPALKDSE